MNKELEEAIKTLEDIKDGSNICLTIELERQEKNKEDIEHYKNEVQEIETVLKELKRIDEIKQKLKDLQKQYKEVLEENSTKALILKCQIEILKEEIEGE